MNKGSRVKACETDLLFVYGTLRRRCLYHEVLRRLHGRFLAKGYVKGSLYDLGEYPGASKVESAGANVRGEIYLFPNPGRALKLLDKFEGFDPLKSDSSLFLRERATVMLAGGRELQAWIYWLRDVRGRKHLPPSGEYRDAGA
jgi:gamma-glutamylcyclotransferase (GGCT)/AIG2-like uncharacterized protein YtfP